MADELWLFIVTGGVALLGVAIAYGIYKQRRLTPDESRRQADKVDELYKHE